MHAAELLQQPGRTPLTPVIVLFGSDAYLRQEALQQICDRLGGEQGEEASISRFAGPEAEFKAVVDELRTVSMFGDSRVVIVEEADAFVSNHRSSLEKLVAAPPRTATLILLVKTWPKTTKLAKAVAKSQLALECSELKGAALVRWAQGTAQQHGKQLSRTEAAALVELAGTSTGQLAQEIAKLAAYVGSRGRISEEDIQAVVGGWSTQTAFVMIDQLMAGRLEKALELLDRLLAADEPPPKILGAISFSFRRLAQAVESARHGMPLKQALTQAGVFRNRIDSTNAYLRRIGRPRAEQILPHLLRAEQNLKGGSKGGERIELEELLVRLSGRLPVEQA